MLQLNSELLPIANKKVINLRTREVRDRLPEDVFPLDSTPLPKDLAKNNPYFDEARRPVEEMFPHPNYDCPVNYNLAYDFAWVESFFLKLAAGDKELSAHIQSICGYILTNRIDDDHALIFVGKESSAAKLLLRVMIKILYQYYDSVDHDLLVKNNQMARHCFSVVWEHVLYHKLYSCSLAPGDILSSSQIDLAIRNSSRGPRCTKLVFYCQNVPAFNLPTLKARVIVLDQEWQCPAEYKEEVYSHIDDIFSHLVEHASEYLKSGELINPNLTKYIPSP